MLILDFDGTIVDVYERYFNIFNDFWKIDDLSLKDYIDTKKKLEYDNIILKHLSRDFSESEYLLYKKFKKKYLEDEQYLKYDNLIINENSMKLIKANYSILITIRRNKINLIKQLELLEIRDIFNEIIILEPNNDKTKYNYFKAQNISMKDCIVIGDSNTDLEISRLSPLKTFFVDSGLKSRRILLDFENIEISKNINEIFKNHLFIKSTDLNEK